jgi:hypothetical protein
VAERLAGLRIGGNAYIDNRAVARERTAQIARRYGVIQIGYKDIHYSHPSVERLKHFA